MRCCADRGSWRPIPGRGAEPHLEQPTDEAAAAGWDFRSPRFRDQALALARMTGLPLVLCRQELFIAEGDAVEAHMVLEERHCSPPAGQASH